MNRSLRKTREYNGNHYHLIRDCVQYQRPFVIYNFTNSKQYNTVLSDLDKYSRLNYVLQALHSIDQSGNRFRKVYPSIFVTNEGTDVPIEDFREMLKGSLKHYNLDSVTCLYDGAVSVFYPNGEHHPIGSTIYGSNQIQEFNSDFYQIESTYYLFIP